MAGLTDKRLEALRKARERVAEHTPTPGHTPQAMEGADDTPVQTPASATAVIPSSTSSEVYTPGRAKTRLPEPRQVMVRTQHFLRPDQIEWLDAMTKRHKGTTRSDFLREAIDLYREVIESEEGEA